MSFVLLSLFGLPAAALEIVTGSLPAAVIHRPYHPAPLQIGGGGRCQANDPNVHIIHGTLPEGITLSAAGYISGIPRRTGTFTFLVRAANTCEITAKTLVLRVEGAPILQASPESIEFRYRIGSAPPAPSTVLVSASWNDLAYAIDADNAPWLSIHPLRGRTPFPGDSLTGDPVKLNVDPSNLKPGVYRTTLRITAWQGVNQPRIPVTLVIASGE